MGTYRQEADGVTPSLLLGGPACSRRANAEFVGAVQQLASELLRNGTTFFLGRRAGLGSPGLPSCPSDITIRLAKHLGLFRLNGEHLLPPPDTIGELFATEYGLAGLEEAMLTADDAPTTSPPCMIASPP